MAVVALSAGVQPHTRNECDPMETESQDQPEILTLEKLANNPALRARVKKTIEESDAILFPNCSGTFQRIDMLDKHTQGVEESHP